MRAALIVLFVSAAARAQPAPAPDPLDALRALAAPCDAARAHCFALALHVAPTDGGLAATPEWLAQQLAEANRHFALIDVSFTVASIDALPAGAAHVVTRKDRNALGAHLTADVIDVFLIQKLEDVDEPGAMVYGVTWPAKHKKFVIVSAEAWPRTLAHELGHVFGLPHSDYAISIMNKTPRDEPPMAERTFAPEEVKLLVDGRRRLVRDKLLRDRAP